MCVTQIRQVATLLGYGEPQILELFKNTLPMKLYWILFPIEDLRQAVETAKRILTKEKLDKQLTGQASTSQFMSIREGASRKVSFDTRDELGDKIDKLTVMIGRLAARDNNDTGPFKLQIHQSTGRGQNRGYSQRNYQNRNRLYKRSNSRDQGQFRQDRDRPRFEPSYRGNHFQDSSRRYSRQNSRREYRNEIIGVVVTIEAGIDQERDHYQETIAVIEIEVQVMVDQDQDPEPVLIRIA